MLPLDVRFDMQALEFLPVSTYISPLLAAKMEYGIDILTEIVLVGLVLLLSQI
jgi:hypothetical protein